MNKSIVAALALSLTACQSDTQYAPKYKVGDCAIHVRNPNAEKWEKTEYDIERIVDVGRAKYHTVSIDSICAYLISRGYEKSCFSSYEFRGFDLYYSVKAQNCPKLEDFPSFQK